MRWVVLGLALVTAAVVSLMVILSLPETAHEELR